MSEPTAERVAAIRERHAYRQLTISEQLLRLQEGFEPCPTARSLEAQAVQDFDALLARLDEQAERVRALEEALWPFAAAADGITPEMDHPILIASHYGAGTGGRATHWQVHVDAFRAARAALSPDSEP